MICRMRARRRRRARRAPPRSRRRPTRSGRRRRSEREPLRQQRLLYLPRGHRAADQRADDGRPFRRRADDVAVVARLPWGSGIARRTIRATPALETFLSAPPRNLERLLRDAPLLRYPGGRGSSRPPSIVGARSGALGRPARAARSRPAAPPGNNAAAAAAAAQRVLPADRGLPRGERGVCAGGRRRLQARGGKPRAADRDRGDRGAAGRAARHAGQGCRGAPP